MYVSIKGKLAQTKLIKLLSFLCAFQHILNFKPSLCKEFSFSTTLLQFQQFNSHYHCEAYRKIQVINSELLKYVSYTFLNSMNFVPY